MNLLAHLVLSPADPEILAGNAAGDLVKGRLDGRFSDGVRRGLLMHRRIDSFVDGHPAHAQASQALRPEYRRYAPILLDVVSDYFLSGGWSEVSDRPLRSVVDEIYVSLGKGPSDLPSRYMQMVSRMVEQDWLGNSEKWFSIERTLSYLASRLKRASPLADAGEELQRCEKELRVAFWKMWPDVVEHARGLETMAAPSLTRRP